MGFLICDKCKGYYELQPGESLEDFSDQCECGGTLKYTRENPEKIKDNTGKQVKLEWKPIIYGILLTFLLSTLFGLIGSGEYLIGFLMATIYVGYNISGNYKNGAIHGIIVGGIVEVILSIIGIILMLQLLEYGVAKFGVITALSPLIKSFATTIVAGLLIGAIGGLIGAFIKGRFSGGNSLDNNSFKYVEFPKNLLKRNVMGIITGIVFFIITTTVSLELLVYTIATHYGTIPLTISPTPSNFFVYFMQIAMIFILTIISGAITTYINKSREYINATFNCLILGIITGILVLIILDYGIPLVVLSSISAILGGWIVISYRKFLQNK
jgi:hypothetical protein